MNFGRRKDDNGTIKNMMNMLSNMSAEDFCKNTGFSMEETNNGTLCYDNGFELRLELSYHDLPYEERLRIREERKQRKHEEDLDKYVAVYSHDLAIKLMLAGYHLMSYDNSVKRDDGRFEDVYKFKRDARSEQIIADFVAKRKEEK